MAVSKVVLGDETLIDLTGDSVSSENLLQGETAHGANGEEVIGGVVVTPMYTGTKAAIEEAIALGQIPEDAVVNITDDEEASSFQEQINEINSSLNYSESEIICGTWIDGKPIYRKVFNVTTGTTLNTFKQYNLSDYGITNVDEIISVNMRLKMSDDGWQVFSADGQYALFDCSKTVIEIKVMNNAYANKPCRFIIEYTKVTD